MNKVKLKAVLEFEINEDIYQRIEFYNALRDNEDDIDKFTEILRDIRDNYPEIYETYQFYRLWPEDGSDDAIMFNDIHDEVEYVEQILFCDVYHQYHGYKKITKLTCDNEMGKDILRYSFMNKDILPGIRKQIFGLIDLDE